MDDLTRLPRRVPLQQPPSPPSAIFNASLLNRYGQSVRSGLFTVQSLSGGVGLMERTGVSFRFTQQAYLFGVVLSATFSQNVGLNADPLAIVIGKDQGQFITLDGAYDVYVSLHHLLGTQSTINLAASKSTSIFFSFPFLPAIQSGERLAGYSRNNMAAGEQSSGLVTFHYVHQPTSIG